jgi:hypothetical protein
VKWNGDTSLSFSINQGFQGGVLSTHLYKQYLNELLNDLENHNIGISIGIFFSVYPTGKFIQKSNLNEITPPHHACAWTQ